MISKVFYWTGKALLYAFLSLMALTVVDILLLQILVYPDSRAWWSSYVSVVQHPDQVEVFTLRQNGFDRPQDEFHIPMVDGPALASASQQAELAEILSDPFSFQGTGFVIIGVKACMPDYGVRFRCVRGDRTVNAYVCFSCLQMLIVEDETRWRYDLRPAAAQKLLDLSRAIIPDSTVLKYTDDPSFTALSRDYMEGEIGIYPLMSAIVSPEKIEASLSGADAGPIVVDAELRRDWTTLINASDLFQIKPAEAITGPIRLRFEQGETVVEMNVDPERGIGQFTSGQSGSQASIEVRPPKESFQRWLEQLLPAPAKVQQ